MGLADIPGRVVTSEEGDQTGGEGDGDGGNVLTFAI